MVARPRLDLPHAVRDDDFGPLVFSWTIAVAVGAAWLTLVYLSPSVLVIPEPIAPPGMPFIGVDPNLGAPPRADTPKRGNQETQGKVVRRQSTSGPIDIAGIFATAVTARAVSAIVKALPGVQEVRGSVGATVAYGNKSTLATADEGTTPGIAKLSAGSEVGAGLGRVQHGGNIDRATFRANALPVVTAPGPNGTVADATELGSFVRGRVAQLQTCYEQAGGTDLAGVVALRITLGQGGAVRAAEIVRRSWSGPAADAAESCLLRMVRGWRLPSGTDGAAVTVPISFTRGT